MKRKKPPKLTDHQKRKLKVLESNLRKAVRLGDCPSAKRLTKEIQLLLRPTGHETRLMKAKNLYFECLIEAGDIETAISGFTGVRKKTSEYTRVYLEAIALLAICYLRKGDMKGAEPFIAESLRRDFNISSKRRRIDFKRRLIARFREEGLFSAVRGYRSENLDVDSIQEQAGFMVQTMTEDELMAKLGESIPIETINFLRKVDEFSKRQLPPDERKLFPIRSDERIKAELGQTFFSSFKRVLWRSLCDPSSDVYKMWFEEGVKAVVNKKVIALAVVAALLEHRIALVGVAVGMTALIFKFGLEVFCDKYQPKGVMVYRDE